MPSSVQSRHKTAATPPKREAKTDQARPWHDWFAHFAYEAARLAGKPVTFLTAVAVVLVWAASGPAFGFSDTWQLVINTGTTIVTFLMVFLIQNTQNRDTRVIQLKLDELIRAVQRARNELVDLEDLSDEELARLQKEFEEVRKKSSTQAPSP